MKLIKKIIIFSILIVSVEPLRCSQSPKQSGLYPSPCTSPRSLLLSKSHIESPRPHSFSRVKSKDKEIESIMENNIDIESPRPRSLSRVKSKDKETENSMENNAEHDRLQNLSKKINHIDQAIETIIQQNINILQQQTTIMSMLTLLQQKQLQDNQNKTQ